MLSSNQWELRRPKDSSLFEEMIRDLFIKQWNDPNAQCHGRTGQKQDGVDVYGRINGTEAWHGIQCKLREDSTLSDKELITEIEMARNFRHKLDTLIFATTLPRDRKLQIRIEKLNEQELSLGSFRIQIRFWEDICSLMDENVKITTKYYGKGGIPRRSPLTIDNSIRSNEISSHTPLLFGVLVDNSKSMINTLTNNSIHSNDSSKETPQNLLSLLTSKIIHYCKTPESNEILPQIAFFSYGYGYQSHRKKMADIATRVGIKFTTTQNIPSSPIRDMFNEGAIKHNIPRTPTASDLYQWNEYYKNSISIESNFFDVGFGASLLGEALVTVSNRFEKELNAPYFKTPLLVVISDGNIDDFSDNELFDSIQLLKDEGIQVICFYIGNKDITDSNRLYKNAIHSWPTNAKRLFTCASIISDDNGIAHELSNIAEEKGWQIEKNAKLFIQINNRQMLDEFTEIMFESIKINL